MSRAVLTVVAVCGWLGVACAQPAPGQLTTIEPLAPQAQPAEWELALQPDGRAEVSRHGSRRLSWETPWWGADWKYAGSRFRVEGDRLTGEVPDLGLRFTGLVTRQPAALVYRVEMTAERALAPVIGGGFEFQLRLGDADAREPELLADNTGFRWPQAAGDLVVRFEPGLANVYFERGQRNRIRAMLVSQAVAAGTTSYTMTVSLPAGGRLVASPAERYGPADPATWPADLMAYDQSPVDLSWLNHKPAGAHGGVQVDGDELVFADGTPARFWGGNLAAYALFVEKPEIEQHARRIAALGYNLMRLHHHDSTRWVNPTVIDKLTGHSRQLDAAALDRLDYWIACLKREGVYVWVDLHVGRQFFAGDVDSPAGTIGGFDEIERRGGEVKGFCYYNDTVRRLMQEFDAAYLSRVNPYTQTAWRDEPAIMGIMITNENDLTHHFGNLMLADKGNPYHHRLFTESVAAFCQQTGLPPARTQQTWLPGPSKIYLNEMEARFNFEMIDHLRGLGVKAPLSTTQTWGGCGVAALPALTLGDVIDVHSYGRAEFLSANPRADANFLHWVAAGAVHGKPVVITEWNVPYPAADRFTAPLAMAAAAGLQGWDAPMIYNYSQDRFGRPDRAREWSTFMDPAISATIPAAALAYRQGHVRPARRHYLVQLDREQLYDQGHSAATLTAVRTLAEQSRVTIGLPEVPELAWDEATRAEPGVEVVTDPTRDHAPPGVTRLDSDTGEISRDWQLGLQTLNTGLTQAAMGWLGGVRVSCTAVTIEAQTPKAVIAVSSLDSVPLGQSRDVLLTAVARVVAPGGRTPFRSEPVSAALTVAGPAGLRLEAIGPDGQPLAEVPAEYRDGRYRFELPGPRPSHWYRLR